MKHVSFAGLAGVLCLFLVFAGCSCSSSQNGTSGSTDTGATGSTDTSATGSGNTGVTEPVAFTVKSSDGKLEGLVGVTPKNGRLEALYQMRIKDDLPSNPVCKPREDCGIITYPPTYTYAMVLNVPGKEKTNSGSLGAVMCNKEKLPTDAFTDFEDFHNEACGTTTAETTSVFFAWVNKYYTSLEELKSAVNFELYDSSKYWYISDEGTGANGIQFRNYSVNMDKAVEETKSVRSYTLQYTEK